MQGSSSKTIRGCLTAALAVVLIAACGEGPDGLGPDSREMNINGTITWDTEKPCGCSQRAKIVAAMNHVMDKLYTHPVAFKTCLRDAVMTRDNGVSADNIIRRLKENLPTEFGCADSKKEACCGGKYKWKAWARGPIDHEKLIFDVGFLGESSAANVAGVLMHEVAHNKGFTHPTNGQYGYQYTVTQQVRHCMHTGTPKGIRSIMHDETELSQVGGDGGRPFTISASPGTFFNGLDVGLGRANNNDLVVRRLGAYQIRVNGGSARWTSNVGGGHMPSTRMRRRCADGEVITGIFGRAEIRVDAIGFRCNRVTQLRANLESKSHWKYVGGGLGGIMFARTCPLGMAVKTIRGRHSNSIDQLRLVCQKVLVPLTQERGAPYSTPLAGSWSGKLYKKHCLGFGVMTGLYGRESSRINQLGGVCKSTYRNSQGRVQRRSGHNHPLPATGAKRAGDHFVERCPDGMALRAVTVWADTRVRRVQGHCVTTTRWAPNVLPNIFAMTTMVAHGGSGGSARTLSCPRGEFVVGLDTFIGTHPTTVNGLRVICRSL